MNEYTLLYMHACIHFRCCFETLFSLLCSLASAMHNYIKLLQATAAYKNTQLLCVKLSWRRLKIWLKQILNWSLWHKWQLLKTTFYPATKINWWLTRIISCCNLILEENKKFGRQFAFNNLSTIDLSSKSRYNSVISENTLAAVAADLAVIQ